MVAVDDGVSHIISSTHVQADGIIGTDFIGKTPCRGREFGLIRCEPEALADYLFDVRKIAFVLKVALQVSFVWEFQNTWIKSKMMLKVIMTPRQFICDPPKKIS